MGINGEKLSSIGKGAAIAAIGAAATYFLAYLTSAEGQADLGIYGPIAVVVLSTAVNALRKFLQSDAPAGPQSQLELPAKADYDDV